MSDIIYSVMINEIFIVRKPMMNILRLKARHIKTISMLVESLEDHYSTVAYSPSSENMATAMIKASLDRKYPRTRFYLTVSRTYKSRTGSDRIFSYDVTCEFTDNKEFNKFKLVEGFNKDGTKSSLT